jgi:hypothetical protein
VGSKPTKGAQGREPAGVDEGNSQKSILYPPRHMSFLTLGPCDFMLDPPPYLLQHEVWEHIPRNLLPKNLLDNKNAS